MCCATPPGPAKNLIYSITVLQMQNMTSYTVCNFISSSFATSGGAFCRLRVEEASRERVRGVLRLVLQRRLQVRGQDEAHPQRLRRRPRGSLERRDVIGRHIGRKCR
jgi:hypothetical protein